MARIKIYLFSAFLFLAVSQAQAQDDLMSLLDNETKEKKSEKVYSTFKSTRLINAQTVEMIKARTLIFRISHRFNDISGGIHSLYGFDNATNIKFSFDYGLYDNLLIGFSRSKEKENLEGSVKYRFLTQTSDNKIPVTIVWFSNIVFTPMVDPRKGDGSKLWTKTVHRLSYAHQFIIGRKFSNSLSFEMLPTIIHRNHIREFINPDNGAKETNTLFAIGAAGRIKITKRTTIVADYFYIFSKFRSNNVIYPYHAPLGIGVEIETGGHVFHINLTNSYGMIENDFIPETPESWLDGDIKLGFSISRVFYF